MIKMPFLLLLIKQRKMCFVHEIFLAGWHIATISKKGCHQNAVI